MLLQPFLVRLPGLPPAPAPPFPAPVTADRCGAALHITRLPPRPASFPPMGCKAPPPVWPRTTTLPRRVFAKLTHVDWRHGSGTPCPAAPPLLVPPLPIPADEGFSLRLQLADFIIQVPMPIRRIPLRAGRGGGGGGGEGSKKTSDVD